MSSVSPGNQQLNTVSVVIPTAGSRASLAVLVWRLTGDPAVREILIVDDRRHPHAPLPLGNVVQRLEPTVRVVTTDTGGGPNTSRQVGLMHARGEVVLFLDDDVLPECSLASAHAQRHLDAALVVVGYMPVPAPHLAQDEPIVRGLYRMEYERRVTGYELDPNTILTRLWGGNVSMRRADAIRVGLASDFRGRRHEDQEFGQRCRAAGLTGVFDRSLLASHRYVRSSRRFLLDAWAQGYERELLQSPPTPPAATAGGPLATVRRAGSAATEPRRSGLRLMRRVQLRRGSLAAMRERRDRNAGAESSRNTTLARDSTG